MNMSMKSVKVDHELYRNRATKVHAVSVSLNRDGTILMVQYAYRYCKLGINALINKCCV